MNKVFSIVSQKGGVGKTTTALNVGIALARKNRRILIVDADPQGGTAYSLGHPSSKDRVHGLLQVLAGEGEVAEFTRTTPVDNLEVIESGVSNTNLSEYEEAARAVSLFREVIHAASGNYDMVLIDCPPGVGSITSGALTASDFVIVPIQSEPLSLRTLPQLLRHLIDAKRSHNHQLDIAGLLITMFDPMNTASQVVAQQIRQHFHTDMVFKSIIPRDPALNLLFSPVDPLQQVLDELSTFSVGLKAYQELADELQDRYLVRTDLSVRTKSVNSMAGVI